jgi:hypothetical protein
VHKSANVFNKLPKSWQSKAQRALQKIWMGETKKQEGCARSVRRLRRNLGAKYDPAVECPIKECAAGFSPVPREVSGSREDVQIGAQVDWVSNRAGFLENGLSFNGLQRSWWGSKVDVDSRLRCAPQRRSPAASGDIGRSRWEQPPSDMRLAPR